MAQGKKPVSAHDLAVWHTVDINLYLDEGRLDHRPVIGTAFPLRHGHDERALAEGGFTLMTYAAAGDGGYAHSSGFFFATGPAGLALTALSVAGRAAVNSRRRREAAAAATLRWRTTEHGLLTVSTHGLYLRGSTGFFPWPYVDVSTAELLGPGLVRFSGSSDQGNIDWIVTSDWAELFFTLWARAVHPSHPQFVGRTWVPPGWAQRMAVDGHALPAHLPLSPGPQDRRD
ncbi:MAG: hypothetical protein M3Y71_02295 [Actinomycetota bacterium]|nr:hypothetical protein [Actinomycetota bacterium]